LLHVLPSSIDIYAHPYGYDYEDGKLKVNEKEAEAVKLMFSRYLEGRSTSDIAEELDERDYPNKRNGCWSARTVGKILKNPVYCGFLEWEDIVFRGEHRALIEVEKFNDVQNLLYQNTRNSKLRRKPRTLGETLFGEQLQKSEEAVNVADAANGS